MFTWEEKCLNSNDNNTVITTQMVELGNNNIVIDIDGKGIDSVDRE